MSNADSVIFGILHRLDAAKIAYRLNAVRPDAIMIEVAVPGERWEIEILGDGSVEVEVFKSNGEMFGLDALDTLLSRFSD